MTHHSHRICMAMLLGAVIWTASTAGRAQDPAPQTLFIGGSQGSSASTYTYAGQIVPLEGARVGQGWFHKSVASWLTYGYSTEIGGAPTQARAGAASFESGWGYAWDGVQLKGDVSLTLGVRDTRLRPRELRADGLHGTRVALTPQVGVRYSFTPQWDADILASYSIGTQSSFSRARIGGRPADTSWRLGVETSLSEGQNYRTQQIGVFAGRDVGLGWFVEMNAGQAQSKNGNNTPYVGMSFSLVR